MPQKVSMYKIHTEDVQNTAGVQSYVALSYLLVTS